MEVRLVVETADGADERELRSLREWLTQERQALGRIETVAGESGPGAMGAVLEAVQVVLGADGAATVLAGSLGTWFATRHRAVKLVVRRPDGAELEIQGEVKDPDAAIERFLAEHTLGS